MSAAHALHVPTNYDPPDPPEPLDATDADADADAFDPLGGTDAEWAQMNGEALMVQNRRVRELEAETAALHATIAMLEGRRLPWPATRADALRWRFALTVPYETVAEAAAQARGLKADAQVARDRDEQPALVRLIAALGIKKTEASQRLEEDDGYRALAEAHRARAREADALETQERIVARRLDALDSYLASCGQRRGEG